MQSLFINKLKSLQTFVFGDGDEVIREIQKELQTGDEYQVLLQKLITNPQFRRTKHLKLNICSILKKREFIKNTTLIVNVYGKTNSGKTAFLNSLIDSDIDIFPENDQPTTFQLFAIRNNPQFNGQHYIYKLSITKEGNFNFQEKEEIFHSSELEEIKQKIIELNIISKQINLYLIELKLIGFGEKDVVFIDTPGSSSNYDTQIQYAINQLRIINYHISLLLVSNENLFQGKDDQQKQIIESNFEQKIKDIKFNFEEQKKEDNKRQNIQMITKIGQLHGLIDIEFEFLKKKSKKNQDSEQENVKNEIQIFFDKALEEKIKKIKEKETFDKIWFYNSKLDKDFNGYENTKEIVGKHNKNFSNLIITEYDKYFSLNARQKIFSKLIMQITETLNFSFESFDLKKFKEKISDSYEQMKIQISFKTVQIKRHYENQKKLDPSKKSKIIEELANFERGLISGELKKIQKEFQNIESLLLLNLIILNVINLDDLLELSHGFASTFKYLELYDYTKEIRFGKFFHFLDSIGLQKLIEMPDFFYRAIHSETDLFIEEYQSYLLNEVSIINLALEYTYDDIKNIVN